MKRRKFLLGSAATLTGSGLLVGTQGYSSVESNREVSIDVVGDEHAYLGLTTDENGSGTATGLLGVEELCPSQDITIVNQTAQGLTVTVEITPEDQISLDGGDRSVTFDLDPGEDEDVGIGLEDNQEIRATTEIHAESDAGGLLIEATRTLDLNPLVDDVDFKGAGHVDIEGEGECSYDLVYWIAEDIKNNNTGNGNGNSNGNRLSPGEITEVSERTNSDFGPDGELPGNRDGELGYIGVYFPDIDTSYHHPQFDPGTGVIDNWGTGPGEPYDGRLF